MDVFVTVLAIIFVIIISSILNNVFHKIPLILFQVSLGIILSYLPFQFTFPFEPEMFIVCFIAPLLFIEGLHFSRTELWEYRTPIFLMSFGLVLATIFGMTVLIYYLMPHISFTFALLIAALLSPTDANAVKSIVKKLHLPRGIAAVLDGESLLNDDIGLITFKVTLTALVTGFYRSGGPLLAFLQEVAGGIVVGFIIGGLLVKLRMFLRRKGLDDINAYMALQIITPFTVYLVAQSFHLSGFFAVVVASMIVSIEKDSFQKTSAKLKVTTTNTWNFLGYILNGFVFTLMGFVLKDIIYELIYVQTTPFLYDIFFTLAVCFGLFLIRYLFIFIFYPYFGDSTNSPYHAGRIKYTLIASLGGVRGALTLAMVFSIPFTMDTGDPFPFRELIMFCAAFVFIIELIAASTILPKICRNVAEDDKNHLTFAAADRIVTTKTIQRLGHMITEENKDAVQAVIRSLEEKVLHLEYMTGMKAGEQKYFALRKIAAEAEKAKAQELFNREQLDPQLKKLFLQYMDKWAHKGMQLSLRGILSHIRFLHIRLNVNTVKESSFIRHEFPPSLQKQGQYLQRETIQAALEAIRESKTEDNQLEAYLLTQSYMSRLQALSGNSIYIEDVNDKDNLVYFQSLEIERQLAKEMFEKEKLTLDMYIQIKERIEYDELLLLEQHLEETEVPVEEDKNHPLTEEFFQNTLQG